MTPSLVFSMHVPCVDFTNILLNCCVCKLQKQFQMIFITGDFHNLWEEEQSDPEKVKKAVSEIQSMLAILLTISPQVYYLPGNHDPFPMFISSTDMKDVQIISKAISIQKRKVEVRPGSPCIFHSIIV